MNQQEACGSSQTSSRSCSGRRLLLLILMMASALPTPAAQTRIHGRVTDGTGETRAEIPVVMLDGTGQSEVNRAQTNAFGLFSLPDVEPGTYTIEVRHSSGVTIARRNISVRDDANVYVGFVVRETPTPATAVGNLVRELPGGVGSAFDSASIRNVPVPSNIWFLIEHLEPSSVADPPDSGGLRALAPRLLSSHGSSWTETEYTVNGARVTDPHETGRTLYVPALSSVDELRITTAMHEAQAGGAGPRVAIETRRGTHTWHGTLPFFFQTRGMQGENLDAALTSLGMTSPPRLLRVRDWKGDLGGPLVNGRVQLFGAYNVYRSSRHVPGFPLAVDEGLDGGLIRSDLTETGPGRLALVWSTQRVRDSHDGASFRVTPEATREARSRSDLYQALWQASPEPNASYQVYFSVARGIGDYLFQPTASGTQIELFRERIEGAAPFETRWDRTRWNLGAQALWLTGRWFGQDHQVRFGADWSRGSSLTRYDVAGDRHLIFDNLETHPYLDGVPIPMSVERFNTPVLPRDTVTETSFFASDQIQLSMPLTLNVGARVALSRGGLPGQESPAGTFIAARSFGPLPGLIDWSSIEPRVAVAYRVGTATVIRAGLSRYGHHLAGSLLDYGNPNALGTETFAWEDGNGDGVLQDGELGPLLRVRGGAYSAIDPELRAPSTRELAISASHAFAGHTATVLLVHRRQHDRVQTINTGVPFDTYQPVQIVDPGERPEVLDDKVLIVFDQDPGTLGQDRFLLTNPEGLGARHRGIQITFSRRDPGRWHYLFTASAYESRGPTNVGNSARENDPGVVGELFLTPNSLINADSRLFFDRAYMVRLAGYWTAPFGVRITGHARYLDGQAYARNLIVRGLNQGPFLVMATPKATLHEGGPRTEYTAQVDLRVQRSLPIASGHSVEAVLDVYNLLNSNNKMLENALSGPSFVNRVPLEIHPPRSVRIGVRYDF